MDLALPYQLPLFPDDGKRCPVCALVLPRQAFPRNRSNKDGLDWRCSACLCTWRQEHRALLSAQAKTRRAAEAPEQRAARLERMRASYQAQRKERLAWMKSYNAEHRAQRQAYRQQRRETETPEQRAARRAYNHALYEAQREERLLKARAYYEQRRDDPQFQAKQQARRRRDAERQAARSLAWRRANPERDRQLHRLKKQRQPDRYRGYAAIGAENRRARQLGAEGVLTPADVQAIYAAQEGLCAYCSTPLPAGFHRDHMTPLSRGGTHWPDNIALCCGRCNRRKHTKTAEEFRRWLSQEI